MSRFSVEELEALLDRGLDQVALERAVGGDLEALEELAWLQTERKLMTARAAQPQLATDSLWSAIESQISSVPTVADSARGLETTERSVWRDKLRWLFSPWTLAGATTAFAVAVTVLWLPVQSNVDDNQLDEAAGMRIAETNDAKSISVATAPEEADVKLARAHEALLEAELAYSAALDLVEDAYLEQKPRLSPVVAQRLDQEFRETRALLRDARSPEFEGVYARRRLLSAYSNRVHSLQSAVISFEEPIP